MAFLPRFQTDRITAATIEGWISVPLSPPGNLQEVAMLLVVDTHFPAQHVHPGLFHDNLMFLLVTSGRTNGRAAQRILAEFLRRPRRRGKKPRQ